MKKLSANEWIAVVAGLCIVGLFFSFGNPLRVIRRSSATPEQNVLQQDVGAAALFSEDTEQNVSGEEHTTTEDYLMVEDKKIGAGDEARKGQIVTVHYSGWLAGGSMFDSSSGRDPFQFVLGAGQVIEGWDRGIVGMKVGGIRILTIPPELGYGSQQVGPIPVNSTLIFEVELLGVQNK